MRQRRMKLEESRRRRQTRVSRRDALSRKEIEYSNSNIKNVLINIEDEETIKSAASICSEQGSFDKIIIATGVLHDENLSPEKSFRYLDKEKLERVFSINTFGPAIISRYFKSANSLALASIIRSNSCPHVSIGRYT